MVHSDLGWSILQRYCVKQARLSLCLLLSHLYSYLSPCLTLVQPTPVFIIPMPTSHPPPLARLLSTTHTRTHSQIQTIDKMEKPTDSNCLLASYTVSFISTSPDVEQPCCLGCSSSLQNHRFALDGTLDPSYARHLGQPAQVHHTLPAVPPPPAGAAQPPLASPAWRTQTPCPCLCWCCCCFLGGSWVERGCCWPGSQNWGGLAAVWHAIDGDKCSRVLLLLHSE